MSVVALSDLLFGDLLTETNMKPLWEKIRGYLLAVSVAFALSATYLTLNGVTLDCLPIENGNVSYTCEYGPRQAAWMNSYCSNRLPWLINYFGGMCLASALTLLCVSSYWLHKPKVIDSFMTFVNMEKKICDLNMTSDGLQIASCKPLCKDASDEKHSKLREVCDGLWKDGRTVDLKEVYFQRNRILIASLIISAVFFIMILVFMALAGDRFLCELAEDDKELIQGNHVFPSRFLCVAQMAYRLIAFNVIFIVSIFFQIIPIFWGRLKLNKQQQVLEKRVNIDFLRFFWKNARPTQSKKFTRLLKHVCGSSATDAIRENLSDALKEEDFGLVRTFLLLTSSKNTTPSENTSPSENQSSLLHMLLSSMPCSKNEVTKDNPSNDQPVTQTNEGVLFLMLKLVDLYKNALKSFPDTMNAIGTDSKDAKKELDNTEKIINEALKCFKEKIPETSCKELLSLTVQRLRWAISANILHQYVTTRNATDGYILINKLNIDYDELDRTYRSFLSYVVDERFKQTLHPIVKRLTRDCTDEFKLYLHENGKSYHISDKINLDQVDLDLSITNSLPMSTTPAGKSQDKIASLHAKFISAGSAGNPSTVFQNLTTQLSHLKFQKWDNEAQNLAKYAYKNDLIRHTTFICLLNSYIVPESTPNESGTLPLRVDDVDETSLVSCGVTSVDGMFINQVLTNSQVKDDNSVSLFVPTAAKYIISRFSQEKRRDCADVIRSYEFLTQKDKDLLLDFIEKCNTIEFNLRQQSSVARNLGVQRNSSSNSNNVSPEDSDTVHERNSDDVTIEITDPSNEHIPLLEQEA